MSKIYFSTRLFSLVAIVFIAHSFDENRRELRVGRFGTEDKSLLAKAFQVA